jgi:hypothetical protein
LQTKEGQGVNTAEHQVLTRIGFVERWLQRAREECLDGDVGRGLLTLVLADAEVRRLLQLTAPAPRRPRPRLRPLVAAAAALVMIAVAAVQSGVLTFRAPVAESAGLAAGLSLRAGTGVLLLPLETTNGATAAPAVSVTAPSIPARQVAPSPKPGAAGRSASTRPQAPARPVAVPVGSTPAGSVARPAPAGSAVSAPIPQTSAPAGAPIPVVAPAPAVNTTISVADLLDLVIVADRALRRSQP